MLLLSERNCQLIRDIPKEIKTLVVYGDQLRIQQVLFLNECGALCTISRWLGRDSCISMNETNFRYGLIAEYQAQLQKNFIYLAAIPDAQPQTPALPPQVSSSASEEFDVFSILAAIPGAQLQTPALPPQMAPHPLMQQAFYMQHPQAAAVAQQQGEGKSHLTHVFAFAFLVCALLASMLAW